MSAVRKLGVVFGLLLVVAGCSTVPISQNIGIPESAPAASTANSVGDANGRGWQVDPQILADVIDGAFYIPGLSMRRAMRVSRAASSIIAVDCGGEPFENLDYTGERLDQGLYPDAELISKKGLVESGSKPAGQRFGGTDECRLQSLPSYDDWFSLNIAWMDIAYDALRSSKMYPVLKKTAVCLNAETGIVVSAEEPTNEFLAKANDHLANENIDWDAESKRLSEGYAKCVVAYAKTMASLLEHPRSEQIERNRELLERFAKELAAAGYTP